MHQEEQQLDMQKNNEVEVIQEFGPGVPTEALNPKSYAFVPSNWTQRIRAAGAKTRKSEGMLTLMHCPTGQYEKED